MEKSLKKRFKIHYLPMFVLSIVFFLILYVFWKPTLPVIPFITYISGYLSILFLFISLLLGPMNLILRRKNPISTYIRRDIGLFGGILGVTHSVVGLFMHFIGKPWLYFVKEVGNDFTIRFDTFGLANYTGLFGALILILLLIISSDYFLGKLKAVKWKNLQRFTYLMFLLVIAHSIFYRLNANKEGLIFFLYLPMLLIVLTFQLVGIGLTIRNQV